VPTSGQEYRLRATERMLYTAVIDVAGQRRDPAPAPTAD